MTFPAHRVSLRSGFTLGSILCFAVGSAALLAGCSTDNAASSFGSGGAGGGTSGGNAGMNQGSGGGGSAGGLTMPIQREGVAVFEFGNFWFEIDPSTAGRITKFMLGQTDVLVPQSASSFNYGSTFWTSPQAMWDWPPPAEIDNAQFSGGVEGSSVVLEGPTAADLGVSLAKTFTPDLSNNSIAIEYTIRNDGTAETTLAPWEVTRVPPGGLTFFPTGDTASGSLQEHTQQDSGVTWFDYASLEMLGNFKLFADGSEGWVAHVHNGLVLIKSFGDVPTGQQAPEEGEIEIFVDDMGRYVEVEEQGAHAPIAAGASTSWTVRWYLRQLPDSATATVGDAELVSFVRGLVGQ